MAYVNHIYVAIGGRLGTNEEWQTGFRLVSDDYANAQEQIDRAAEYTSDIQPAVLDWWDAVAPALSGAAHFDFLKVNAIGPDGRYLSPTTNATFWPPDEPNHVGMGAPFPFQVSLVMSLETAFVRGRAARGRMYLPIANSSIDPGTGQITTSAPETLATATAALFTDIDDNPGLDLANTRVAIVSSLGPFNDVTAVKAGKVPDTQRRRRASLVENYGPSHPVSL